ncbi:MULTISPECIES: iron-siderophore ABC transporter substrate-binding protein [Streptomyces]|uniref:Iron-siderophore ABC transporter substrate-binding protein n=1 Tax=Streptomyces doudnae TaxID=3075536 RepID=A0ABD5EQ82_9ACTN|nr:MULTISPECIES: iron-siderophore ABC transporter substrate-binding protein [unclassified Streptomyces]MDT0436780.1 iron-siderophore ABC transporter substrate-binding protein [Streptomyces sp. DSM 41981]MYQ62455.1 ABC transporter substrate-binding protein [Streptomyces sp. SID4950]SCD37935.1 iron complex transport system substrate-binding protein [Streptomyces sp. SolWspMP-5a-2]
MSRPLRTTLLTVTLVAGLAACGSVKDDSDGGSSTGSATPGASSAFPVTVTHKFGDTKLTSAPKRVVVVGNGGTDDVDALYALGVTPIAVTKDSLSSDGIYPWLKDRIDTSKTKLIDTLNGIDFEQIAALQPDLILATSDFTLDKDYKKLSAVAPTIGYATAWGQQSWQEHVQVVGKALGRQAQAEKLVKETEDGIAAVREKHPGLDGRTYSLSIGNTPAKIYTIASEKDFAARLMSELGLGLTPSVKNIKTVNGSPTGELSFEQLDRLDADLVVIAFTTKDLQKAFEASTLVKNMAAVKKDRYVVTDVETISQLRSPSVLGIPWALRNLEPGFAKLGD